MDNIRLTEAIRCLNAAEDKVYNALGASWEGKTAQSWLICVKSAIETARRIIQAPPNGDG